MALPAPRPITDLGIRIPDAIPLPLDPDLMRTVAENAAMTRGSGLALIKEAIARDPAIKLAAILMAVKLLAFGLTAARSVRLKSTSTHRLCKPRDCRPRTSRRRYRRRSWSPHRSAARPIRAMTRYWRKRKHL